MFYQKRWHKCELADNKRRLKKIVHVREELFKSYKWKKEEHGNPRTSYTFPKEDQSCDPQHYEVQIASSPVEI